MPRYRTYEQKLHMIERLEDEVHWLRDKMEDMDEEGFEYAKLLVRVEELEYQLYELLED